MQFAVEAVAEQVEKGFDLDEGQAIDLARRIRSALQPDKESGESEHLDAMLAGLKGRPEMLEVLSADKVGEARDGRCRGSQCLRADALPRGFPGPWRGDRRLAYRGNHDHQQPYRADGRQKLVRLPHPVFALARGCPRGRCCCAIPNANA